MRTKSFDLLAKVSIALLEKSPQSVNELGYSTGSNWKTIMNVLDTLTFFGIVQEMERKKITRQYKISEIKASPKDVLTLRTFQIPVRERFLKKESEKK